MSKAGLALTNTNAKDSALVLVTVADMTNN